MVSLFSGCGGLDLGFRESFNLLYACDNDPAAVDTYRRNVHDSAELRDIGSDAFHSDVDALGQCDVVLGGFPCQGFSKAGPKRENDERNALYKEMIGAVAKLSPRVFVAENVDGISQNFSGAYVQRIVSDFLSIGYAVEHRLLDAVNFGAAQYRRRVFFVGRRLDQLTEFSWPRESHFAGTRNGDFRVSRGPLLDAIEQGGPTRDVRPAKRICDAIGDLTELSDVRADHVITSNWPDKYRIVFERIGPGQKLCNVRHAASSVRTWDIPEVFGPTTSRERRLLETIARYRRHKRFGQIPNGNPLPVTDIERLSGLSNVEEDLEQLVERNYLKRVGGAFDLKGAMFCSGIFKRPRWDEPSPTVLTNYHNPRYFLHPLRDGPFSLRECARLQGFPDDFVFQSPRTSLIDGYRLVGNAVAVQMSAALATSVLSYLAATERSDAMIA